ncbi:MAG: hypothetical protein AB7G28_20910 [Pirellulales bacterium]
MADWLDNSSADTADVEALIRSAGGYVRASDDLRPRILEAARLQRHERRAQRWLRRAAVVVLLLATVGGTLEQDNARSTRPIGIVMAAGFDEFFVPTAVASVGATDGDWRMIDAFTELRRQQAQVLRLSL